MKPLNFDPPGMRIFACRVCQILLGIVLTALSAASSSEVPLLYGVSAGCAAVLILDGYVGMFAFMRPRDVHWHLVLSFDYLGLVMGLAVAGIFTVYAYYTRFDPASWAQYVDRTIAGTVLSYIVLLATAYAIFRVHRANRQGNGGDAIVLEQYGRDWAGADNGDASRAANAGTA